MAEEFNHFPQIADALHSRISKAVRKAAFDVQNRAAQQAPFHFGFLRSSIYTVTSDTSSYGSGIVGDGELLPEIPRAEDDTTAYVAVGASYGIYQEMGTRHMPAHPYLVPALEAVRSSFLAALKRLESDLGG